MRKVYGGGVGEVVLEDSGEVSGKVVGEDGCESGG